MLVGLRPRRLTDELAIVGYLEIQNAGLGERFNVAFQDTIEMLLAIPDLGRDLKLFDARRLNLRGFSFHLIYRVESNMLIIYAVAHHKRSPNWLNRLI